jgi:hypothetical protein
LHRRQLELTPIRWRKRQSQLLREPDEAGPHFAHEVCYSQPFGCKALYDGAGGSLNDQLGIRAMKGDLDLLFILSAR